MVVDMLVVSSYSGAHCARLVEQQQHSDCSGGGAVTNRHGPEVRLRDELGFT
jgi:hypothetical protein